MRGTSLVLAVLLIALAWAALIPICGIRRLSRPTILGTAFLVAVGAHFIPACIFLFDPTMPQALVFFWGTTLALAMLPVGGGLANLMFRFSRREVDAFFDEATGTPPLLRDRLLVLTFALFLFVVCAGYIYEVQSYPFGLLLRGGIDTAILNALRHEVVGPEMGSRFWYLYGVARVALMPMLFALVVSGWSSFRGALERGVAVLAVIAAFVFNSWSGAKTPVAMLFLLGLFIMVMRGRRVAVQHGRPAGPAPRRWKRIMAAVLLGSLVIAYPFFVFSRKAFGQTHGAFDVLYEGIFKRIFFKPALLSYYQFEMFPAHFPFTEFRDIGKIAQLFGREYFDLSMMTSIYTTGSPVGNAPPAAFGNFWAQGGWPVLAIGALMVGFVLQGMQIWFVRKVPRNLLALGLCSVLLWSGFRVSMAGFHNIFLSEGIIPTLAFVVLWRMWRAGARAPLAALPAEPATSQ